MKILSLELLAFGIFKCQRLDFSATDSGMHIIFGNNERGKSTTLRAIQALLYGIPERTPDSFCHNTRELRIGGCLAHSDGSKLDFIRRKGRKNTILCPKSLKPLSDDTLNKYLENVSLEVFKNLFGIDHTALVQGGKALLDQNGEIGNALFSAAFGTINLKNLAETLEEEAYSIFKPRATKTMLSKAVEQFNKSISQIKTSALSSKEWMEQHNEKRHATSKIKKIDAEIIALKRDETYLTRLMRTLPLIAQRNRLLGQLAALGDVITLKDDFSQTRSLFETKLTNAKEGLAHIKNKKRQITGEIGRINISDKIIAHAKTIDLLQEKQAIVNRAAQEKTTISGRCAQLNRDIAGLARNPLIGICPSAIEKYRHPVANTSYIRELSSQYQIRIQTLDKAKRKVTKIAGEIAIHQKEISQLQLLPDIKDLTLAVKNARKYGNLDGDFVESKLELEKIQNQLDARKARLTLFSGEIDELVKLKLPQEKTIDCFKEKFEHFNREIGEYKAKIEKIEGELADCRKELKQLLLTSTVPSETELNEIRTKRDQLWQPIRGRFNENGSFNPDGFDPKVLELFEHQLTCCDNIADRLRREADRVQLKASLIAKEYKLEQDLIRVRAKEVELSSQIKALKERWQKIWSLCGIEPLGPSQMKDWSHKVQEIIDLHELLITARQRFTSIKDAFGQHQKTLNEALKRLGKSANRSTDALEPLILMGEECVAHYESILVHQKELATIILTLESQKQDAEQEATDAVESLDQWKKQWQDAIKVLDDEANIATLTSSSVANVNEKLRLLGELLAKYDKKKSLEERLLEIATEHSGFRKDVRDFLVRIKYPGCYDDHQIDGIVLELREHLESNKKAKATKLQLEKQLKELEGELLQATSLFSALKEKLQKLREEAGISEYESFERVERESKFSRELKVKLAEIENRLLGEGDGLKLELIIAEAEGTNPDEVYSKKIAIGCKIEELEKERHRLHEIRGQSQARLDYWEATAGSHDAAQTAQSILANIKSHSERYLCLTMATTILKQQIEEYRRRNQDPLLQRASEVFAQLTCNSFVGLTSEFNEDDIPVLVGVRPDGSQVQITGMSEGTADELYLALRVAAIEKYIAGSEPLPFILDDVLIGFDNDRSLAALEVLIQLAKKTQVIMFTHHAHLLDLIAKAHLDTKVQIHELSH